MKRKPPRGKKQRKIWMQKWLKGFKREVKLAKNEARADRYNLR